MKNISFDLFISYLKQRRRGLAALLTFAAIYAATMMLYGVDPMMLVYPTVLCLVIGVIFIAVDLIRVSRRHAEMSHLASLGSEGVPLLPMCDGIDQESDREMIDALVSELKKEKTAADKRYSDAVDYFTLWAHQIKTPIASMRLILSGEDSQSSRQLMSDLFRTEQYVGMALTYLRLSPETSDLVIKEYAIEPIVRSCVRKFSHEFILRHLTVEITPTDAVTVTDSKWLALIVEQVLSNALKYTYSGGITIYTGPPCTLVIKDTGIGIAPEDLPRIFDRGYTGSAGRSDTRSSGIGLWLCRRAADMLGHSIIVLSEPGRGTEVRIDLSRKFSAEE